MNAVMPSSWPPASCCQSSQPTLIVVSAAPSSSLTRCRAVEHHRALASPKSILTRLPGIHACPCLHPRDQFLLGHRLLLLCQVAASAACCRRNKRAPICAAMGYETSLQLFIDGVWKSGEGRDCHDVINPVDAQPIAALPYATKADLDEALAASDRAWPEWRATDVEKRGAILHKTAALLRERADLIARDDDPGAGQAARRGQARSARLGPAVRLVRRGRQARLRPHPRPPGGPGQPRDPPAGRPDRDLHAVEFPDLSARQEGQRRARRRLHRDLAPAARDARAAAPSCSARSPMPAFPRASPSWSTATAAWSARR